jgi:hypothetical protein
MPLAPPSEMVLAMTATRHRPPRVAREGDWLEVHAVGGGPPRRGQILEVLGRPGHERYRVRWDEQRESIHYPQAGGSSVERIVRRRRRA